MDEDLKELANMEIADLIARPLIPLQIEPFLLFMLIGQLQLALRCPGNTGPTSKIVRDFIADARSVLAEPGSALDTMLKMGDDPTFDVER